MKSNRIVCAANKNPLTGNIVLGVRHHDQLMNEQIRREATINEYTEQGFVDRNYVWHTREDAWKIAQAAGQLICIESWNNVVGYNGTLYSENLY